MRGNLCPDTDKAVPDEDEFPESLPGFDLSEGLKRLQGNRRLYRKLLLDFGANYTQVAGDIGKALDKKDLKQAHSLVHDFKGLAGNLAAIDLQAAAVEMERLVKGESKKAAFGEDLNQKFAKLKDSLNQTLEAVQTKYGNKRRDEDDIAKMQKRLLGRCITDLFKT